MEAPPPFYVMTQLTRMSIILSRWGLSQPPSTQDGDESDSLVKQDGGESDSLAKQDGGKADSLVKQNGGHSSSWARRSWDWFNLLVKVRLLMLTPC